MRVGHEVALALVTLSAVLVSCGGSGAPNDHAAAGTSGAGTGGLSAGGAIGSAQAGAVGISGHAGTSGGAPSQSGGAAGTSGASAVNSGGVGGTGGTGGASGSPGTGGTGGTGGTVVLSPPFMAIATNFCAAARTCCAKAGAQTMLGDCEAAFGSRQQALPSVASGTVTVDNAALARCQAAYEQAATACDENTLLDACKGLYLGTKSVDQSCLNSYECKRDQGGMTCFFADNATVGVCKKIPHGKNGDACLTSCRTGDGDCSSETLGPADSNITLCYESDGVYCDYYSGSAAVCKPILPAGAPCTSSDSCGTLGICYTTCQPSGVLHGPCGMGCRHELTCVNDKCEDPSLAVGSICDGYAPLP